jgi:hypothetical protein
MIKFFEWCKEGDNWIYPAMLIGGLSWAIGHVIGNIPRRPIYIQKDKPDNKN